MVKPLKKIYESNSLHIISIEKHPIHGGSLRIYASKNSLKEDKSVKDFLNFENNYSTFFEILGHQQLTPHQSI